MNKLLLLIFFVFGLGLAQAQWVIYDCSVLPNEADPAWYEQDATNEDGLPDLATLIDDPDISGNKLIQLGDWIGDTKEMWAIDWDMTAETGATVVFRVKPTPEILEVEPPGNDGGDVKYWFVGVRNGLWRDNIRTWIDTLESDRLDLKVPVNTTEWHIWRLTIKGQEINVYQDEDTTPILSGLSTSESSDNYIKWGEKDSGRKCGALWDWIVYDISGAYAPGEGTAIPQELLDTGSISAIPAMEGNIQPTEYHLAQNYPNPFNPSTTISFDLVATEQVNLKIYDINGRLVRTLVDGAAAAGTHQVKWDGRDSMGNVVTAGIYMYRLQAGNMNFVRKMILVK
jgi:hypothetical protein